METNAMETNAIAEMQQFAGTRTVDARVLSGQGLLVTLSIGRWRARKTLGYDDLGILTPEDEATRKALDACLQLGRKRLLPRDCDKQLNAVEATARANLQAHALKTPWGAFVPYTAYLAWKRNNEAYQARFLELRDALLRDRDALIEEILRDYERAAAHAYATLIAVHPDMRTPYPTRQTYVDQFCERIRSLIPARDAIRDSFTYTVKLDQITFAGQVDIPEAADSSALRAMRQDLDRELRQRAASELESFLKATMSQVRTIVYEVSSSVLASIQRKGHVTHTSAVRLSELVEQVQQLNFTNDQEIAAMLAQIQQWLGTPTKTRDVETIADRLSDIATLCRAELIDLGHSLRVARSTAGEDGDEAEIPLDRAKRFARYHLGISFESEGLEDLLLRRQRHRRGDLVQLAFLDDSQEALVS